MKLANIQSMSLEQFRFLMKNQTVVLQKVVDSEVREAFAAIGIGHVQYCQPYYFVDFSNTRLLLEIDVSTTANMTGDSFEIVYIFNAVLHGECKINERCVNGADRQQRCSVTFEDIYDVSNDNFVFYKTANGKVLGRQYEIKDIADVKKEIQRAVSLFVQAYPHAYEYDSLEYFFKNAS